MNKELRLLGKEKWLSVSFLESTKDDPRVHIASKACNSEGEEILAISLKPDEALDLLDWLQQQQQDLEYLRSNS